MNNKKERLQANVTQLLDEQSFFDVLKNSVHHLKPGKIRLLVLVVFFVSCCFVLYFTDFFVVGVKNVLNLLLPILATLLTMSFAGFAIFQVMISPETMKIFMKNNSGEQSLFLDVNSEYFALFVMELVLLVIGLCLIIALNLLPIGWRISVLSNSQNIVLASLVVGAYFTICINTVIEIKSFAFNLYQCFKLVAINNLYNENENSEDS